MCSSVDAILDKKNQLQMRSFILLADAVLLLSLPPHSSYRGVSLVEENTEHIIFVHILFLWQSWGLTKAIKLLRPNGLSNSSELSAHLFLPRGNSRQYILFQTPFIDSRTPKLITSSFPRVVSMHRYYTAYMGKVVDICSWVRYLVLHLSMQRNGKF